MDTSQKIEYFFFNFWLEPFIFYILLSIMSSREPSLDQSVPLAKRIRRNWVMYLFLAPAVCAVIIFAYVPMIGVVMAFQDYDIITGYFSSPWAGLKHFRNFLAKPAFWQSLKNTLGINGLSILIGFPLPIVFAIMIFTMKNSPYKRITQTISYLPHFVSWVVVSGLVYKMLDNDTGIINFLLTKFGLERVAFMRVPGYFWGAIIITAVWKELGWNSIIFLAALSAIDAEQYEAAIVDGANGFYRLIYITIPGILPTVGLMLIMTVGTLVNANGNVSFDAVFNLRNPLLASAANTIDYYVYAEGIANNNLSYSAAVGLTQSLVSLFLVLMANKISRKAQGYGAF
ncbi:MAG: ABC transporter permease subunit [Treponema sp.]|jgi:putative aldouronate transport system permease protein|nr:ABC transporter permease subunit [Treponema sp.]